ncbi:MAG: hypothetical protein ABXS91_10165 [Sulfurimonas sp.]
MKKLLAVTAILGLFIGTNGYAASPTALKEDKVVHAIQTGAQNDAWRQYTPSMKCATQTLYFKKRLKNREYYSYRYQNRHRNRHTTVYAKVDYTTNGFNVEFVDKVGMNLGRLGIDNKIDKSLEELKAAIDLELARRS